MIKDFKRFAPKTLQETVTLLDKYADDAKIICGGQSLLVLMKQGLVAPDYIIDIKGIEELDYIKEDSSGVKIGALTTHRTIEKSPVMKGTLQVLAEMETRLASIQTRNWGTIGGNLAHGDPAGDPAPVLIALNASVKLASVKGERVIPLEEFYLDYFETVMEPGEIIAEIIIPTPAPRTGVSYKKFNIIQSDMATVSVAASITLNGDTCTDVCIALGAAAPTPIRAKNAEELLKGKQLTDELLAEAGKAAAAEAEPISDIAASAEYRRELIRVMAGRMVKEAATRAGQS